MRKRNKECIREIEIGIGEKILREGQKREDEMKECMNNRLKEWEEERRNEIVSESDREREREREGKTDRGRERKWV